MATHDSNYGNGYPPSLEVESRDYASTVCEAVANPLMWVYELEGYFDELAEGLAEEGVDVSDPEVVRGVAYQYVRLFTYDRGHPDDRTNEAPMLAAARFERSLTLRDIQHPSFAEYLQRCGVRADQATADHVTGYYRELGGPFRSAYDDYEPEQEDVYDYPVEERPLDLLIDAVLDTIVPQLVVDERFLTDLRRRVADD